MSKQLVSANRPWEKIVGYSRAVRVGNVVEVAGTAAADSEGRVIAPGDVYGQTKEILRIIGRALEEAGASLEDVVRTRIYLTDISEWEEAGRAHGEVFSEIRPASTAVGVEGFVHPQLLVEVEATAIIDRG